MAFGIAVVTLAVVGSSCSGAAEISQPTSIQPTTTATSSGDDSLEPIISLPGEPYRIEFEAQATNAQVTVVGTTNLPEGAELIASGSRAQISAGESDVRAVSVGSAASTVTAGEFSMTFPVDLGVLLLLDPEFDTVAQLDDNLTVCVEFRTGTDFDGVPRQSDPVSAVVGTYGEGLEGSAQASVFGSLTENPSNWLEALAEVEVPNDDTLDQVNTTQTWAVAELAGLEGFCA